MEVMDMELRDNLDVSFIEKEPWMDKKAFLEWKSAELTVKKMKEKMTYNDSCVLLSIKSQDDPEDEGDQPCKDYINRLEMGALKCREFLKCGKKVTFATFGGLHGKNKLELALMGKEWLRLKFKPEIDDGLVDIVTFDNVKGGDSEDAMTIYAMEKLGFNDINTIVVMSPTQDCRARLNFIAKGRLPKFLILEQDDERHTMTFEIWAAYNKLLEGPASVQKKLNAAIALYLSTPGDLSSDQLKDIDTLGAAHAKRRENNI